MKKVAIIVFAIVFFAFTSQAAMADGVYGGYGAPCQPIYGGGETCISNGNLLLNKTVQNPTTKAYVDNLSLSSDPKYGPDQKVNFQIAVTNNGSSTLSEVTVTDDFPSFINFASGPGTYDSKSKVLTFKVYNLATNETRTYTVTGKIVSSASLPSNKAVNCVINQAQAASGSNDSSDISQLCIENNVTTKGGLPVYSAPSMNQTPATGPEMLPLLAMIPTALAGFALRRKSK